MNRAFINVGYELTEPQLRTHFVHFGVISDLYLPKHNSGRNKGFAFVTFDSAEALERALLATAHTVDGIAVQVKRAGPRPPVSESEVPAAELLKQQPFGKGPRLYIGGVADAISEEKIRLHFAKWGNIADVYFPGKVGQRRVNYCFVTFDDWATAQQACNQSDRNIDGWVRAPRPFVKSELQFHDQSQMLCLQPLDCITMASTRQQDVPASLGSNASPHLLSGSHAVQRLAASLPEPLASLPACPSWLQPQSDHFQAASAAPSALMQIPVDQSISPDVPSVQHSHLSLAERQHVFMQGVHAGMQLNTLSAADVQVSSLGAGASITDSWLNFQPGLSPLAPAGGLHSLPQYLNAAVETQVGAYSLQQAPGAAGTQLYNHSLYR